MTEETVKGADDGRQFTANDLAAYAVGLRGRGKSDGERFYVRAFADYVSGRRL